MITRKHYKVFAELLQKSGSLDDFTIRLCEYLKTDNSRFDAERFKKAINTIKPECMDCNRIITNDEYAENKGKCDRCGIGDNYA